MNQKDNESAQAQEMGDIGDDVANNEINSGEQEKEKEGSRERLEGGKEEMGSNEENSRE